MKKFLFAISIAIFFAMVLAGCSKNSTKDEFGIFHDLDETISAAEKSDKKILLVFTKLDSGGFNETLVNQVLHAQDYQEKLGAEFETCQIDFSKEDFSSEKNSRSGNSSRKKSAKKTKAQIERNMRATVIYGVETPPTVMILSPQGYVISSITYLSCINVTEFSNIVEVEREKIDAMEKLVSAVKSANGQEKISAIDLLYENTHTNYRYQLRELCDEVVRLDKKNESGLVGKYLLARAATEAMDCYLERKPEKAAECYTKYVSSQFLSVEQKQQCYYAAAYITGNERPSVEVSEKILGYLNSLVELDSQTPLAKQAKILSERQQEILKRQKEIEVKKDEEAQQ
uniref:Lipoprotein n=1 Tax=uncultured Spirochaetaceae bacterium TaxID=201186 RepID=A0A650ENS7_9SPIO|nr:lipoprotein [uncultured Spirochaetaceae bacterium]